MMPPQVDILSIISARAHRYFFNEDTVGEGMVLRGDSRSRNMLARVSRRLEKAGQNVGLVVTSPPYYGMCTYIPDQWLRNWFVGGPEKVDYCTASQISHKGIDTFSKDLETVWRRCAKLAVPNAVLAIRFGAINDRAVDPETIIRKSLDETPWTVLDIHGAGISPPKSRQANSFIAGSRPKKQIEEIDVIARLDKR